MQTNGADRKNQQRGPAQKKKIDRQPRVSRTSRGGSKFHLGHWSSNHHLALLDGQRAHACRARSSSESTPICKPPPNSPEAAAHACRFKVAAAPAKIQARPPPPTHAWIYRFRSRLLILSPPSTNTPSRTSTRSTHTSQWVSRKVTPRRVPVFSRLAAPSATPSVPASLTRVRAVLLVLSRIVRNTSACIMHWSFVSLRDEVLPSFLESPARSES